MSTNTQITPTWIIPTDQFSSQTDDAVGGAVGGMYANATHAPSTSTNNDMIMAYIYFNLTALMSLLSVIGSLVVISTYVFYPGLRTSGRLLLVYLSLADLLTALGNLVGITWYMVHDDLSTHASDVLCRSHSFLTIFSSIASFFWTIVIAFHLYLCIVLCKIQRANRLQWVFHLVSWGLPLTIATVAVAMGVLGSDPDVPYPSWCWIDPGSTEYVIMWQYVTGKMWEIPSYFLSTGFYAVVKYTLIVQMRKFHHSDRSTVDNNHSTVSSTNGNDVTENGNGQRAERGEGGSGHPPPVNSNNAVMYEANRNLTFVPVVFIAVRIWGTIRFIVGAHFPQYSTHTALIVVVILQGLGDSAQGCANCILFCVMTSRVRRTIHSSVTRGVSRLISWIRRTTEHAHSKGEERGRRLRARDGEGEETQTLRLQTAHTVA